MRAIVVVEHDAEAIAASIETVGDGARVATPTGADSEGATLDDDESELIARALCEMNAIKRAFAAWRREAVKEKYRRAREREIESLCAFSTGRRARKMALAAIGAWRTNARKRVRLRAFAAKRARRELATTGRAVARAWARIARDDAARRLEAFRQTQTRRNRRAMLAAFNAWRSRARARVARESADVWRRIKLESTALDTWSAVARAWKSERRAIDAARLARQRYVKRSVTRVWRVRVIHAERRAERAVVAVKFSRWRRRVRDERRERERMRLRVAPAAEDDDARREGGMEQEEPVHQPVGVVEFPLQAPAVAPVGELVGAFVGGPSVGVIVGVVVVAGVVAGGLPHWPGPFSGLAAARAGSAKM